MQKLHLDNIYKNHFQEFFLADGSIKNSREINWRQVEWEKVVKISTSIKGRKHEEVCSHPNFQFFLNFRWGGHVWVDNVKKIVNIWTTGWTDGTNAFLTNIDFHTGEILQKYISPLSSFKQHIHPRVMKESLCLYS